MNLESIPGELDAIKKRMDKGDERMTRIEASIAENTEVTKEVRDLMIAGRFLRRVLVFWAPFAAAITALVAWIKSRA